MNCGHSWQNKQLVHQTSSGQRIIAFVWLLFHVESFGHLWNSLFCIIFNISLYLFTGVICGTLGLLLWEQFLFLDFAWMSLWCDGHSVLHRGTGCSFVKSFTLGKVTLGRNFKETREGVMMKRRRRWHHVLALFKPKRSLKVVVKRKISHRFFFRIVKTLFQSSYTQEPRKWMTP